MLIFSLEANASPQQQEDSCKQEFTAADDDRAAGLTMDLRHRYSLLQRQNKPYSLNRNWIENIYNQ